MATKEKLWKTQFKALLKKNFYLKRRYMNITVWEFVIPLLQVLIFGIIKFSISQNATDPVTEFSSTALGSSGTTNFLDGELLVAPNTSETMQIADAVCQRTFCTYILFDNEDDAKSHYTNAKLPSMGLFFEPNNMTSYTVRYPTAAQVPSAVLSTDPADCSYQGCPASTFLTSGIAYLQTIVDAELIKMQNVSGYIPANLSAHLMPELKDVVSRDGTLRLMFPLYMVYAMAFLLMYICFAIVDDKVKKRKDHLTMMGVQSISYWLAWVVVSIPTSLIIAVLTVIIMVAFNFFTTSVAFVFFFIALIFYCINNIILAITWSCIIQKTELIFITLMGTIAVGAIGLINVYYTDYDSDYTNPTSNIYVLGGFVCLFPPACMVSLLERMYSMDSRYPGGLTSSAFFAGDLSLFAMLMILILDIFIWMVLAVWFDGILPNTFGAKLSCCFCFNRKYWWPDPADPNVVKGYEQVAGPRELNDIESVARSLVGKESVRLFNIKKEFRQKTGMFTEDIIPAVRGINLDIYEGQITALLGHNGAGKTTLINVMTGIMPVSSGSATLYGYDVVNGVDLQSIRELMGVCKQENVIYERLSVREHLQLYGRIKGISEDVLQQKIENTIADVDLVDQADVFADKLSGGQKRKLNVGMALIGDPKILFLDEPTAGMDPYSRRHIWDLLKKSREGRVILLTTHFMDEADILADRKAVISKGKLQCAGSSLYLKNKYGVGYQLTILVDDLTAQESLTQLVGQVVEGGAHKRTFGKEITYNLPIERSGDFAELFKQLDAKTSELTVSSYSIAMTTLEEVFLKLGEQAEEEERKEKEGKTSRVSPEDSQEVMINMVDEQGCMSIEEILVNPNDVVREENVNTARLRFSNMLLLRLRMIPREGFIIVALVFYAIFTAVGVVLLAVSGSGLTTPTTPEKRILGLVDSLSDPNVKGGNYGANRVLYHNLTNGDIDALLTPLSTQLQPLTLHSYDGDYTTKMAASPFGYDVNEFADVLSPSNMTVRYNHTYFLSLPLAINILGSTLLRIATNNSASSIHTALTEWPSYDPITYTFNSGSFAGLSFVMALHIGSAMFAVTIVAEKEKKLRPLLRTAGVTVNTYFGVMMALCMILLTPILVASWVAILACQLPAYSVPGAAVFLLIHLIIQLVLTILLVFCWSYAFDRAQSAGNIVSINMWVSMIIFSPMSVLVNIPQTVKIAKIVHHILCFVIPVYSFPGGLLMIEQTYRSYIVSQGDADAIPPSEVYFYPENGLISALLGGLLWVGILTVFLRLGEVKQNGGRLSDLCKCFSNSLSLYDPRAKNSDVPQEEDVDVTKERNVVNDMLDGASALPQDVVMVGTSLRKSFPRKGRPEKLAVRNVTFLVGEGEVFGLLGPNGAGKSTLLNMVIAEHAPSAGKVIVDNVEVHSALSEAFEIIGYCPQTDAVWPAVTAKELLVFYGISSGFTKSQAQDVAEYYIKMLQIDEHKNKFAKNLSGGTLRKVSFALALMGWPRLVLLDEPSTGLDPSSKRFLWDTIRASFNGHQRSAILTTHYMEEADALCNRIGIMVNGALECLGTAQHLKNKYGDGYQLEIKLTDSGDSQQAMRRLKEFIEREYRDCSVIEEFSDRIQYAMPIDSVSSPSQVFGPLEQHKQSLQIEEYSFSQSTLEQVFIQFAKQQIEADEDEDNVQKARSHMRVLLRQKSSSGVANTAYNTEL